MDGSLTQQFAELWLGLRLTDSEAAALVQPLAGLQKLVRLLDDVPLPYTDDPFVSPGTGDAWLETWPDDQ